MNRERGKQTIVFKNKPIIIGHYSIVGPKEGKGNLREYFSEISDDDFFGQKTYEKGERVMVERALQGAVKNAGITFNDVRLFLAGDLLNQIISSSYAARSVDIPYCGVFGACSTMAETLALGSCLVDGEHFDTVACATSSHFSTAERQFRYPLELGNQRPPTAQWTVTGAGATILSRKGHGPRIVSATFGKVTDWGISDVNNMGAAMASAAMNTLLAHFKDRNSKPEDYDLILSGDLGKLGSEILIDLMEDHGYKLGLNYKDCGQIIFKRNQDVLMGGRGCGCSASVLNSIIINGGTLKIKFDSQDLNVDCYTTHSFALRRYSALKNGEVEVMPNIDYSDYMKIKNTKIKYKYSKYKNILDMFTEYCL